MGTGTTEKTDTTAGGKAEGAHAGQDVRVTVEYLPASAPFHQAYPGATTLEAVRADAMAFFGVRDHQDRDTHRFFLEFEGARVTNTAQTLDQILGIHRRGAH